MSEGIGNPLTNSPAVIGNFCTEHILVRGLLGPSDPLPEFIDYSTEHSAVGVG